MNGWHQELCHKLFLHLKPVYEDDSHLSGSKTLDSGCGNWQNIECVPLYE